MKKTITDKKSGKQMVILYDNEYLPVFGEDGIQYFYLTNLFDGFGNLRNDCTIVDPDNGIALKPMKSSSNSSESLTFAFDKEAFEKAESLKEYAYLLRSKGLIKD